jgi:osmotically-inducible protein OsmY
LNPLFKSAAIILVSLVGMLALTQLQGCVGGVIAAGGAGAAVAVDRRSAGTIVDDEAIELKISKAINEDNALGEKAHINITSYNNIVLLTGETPTDAMRDHAVSLARHTEKVRKVYNEIVVAEPTTVKSRSEDTWITAKVKTKLLGIKEVSATNIKVITENRVVYLMGLVSHAEAQAASEAARFVDGVTKVVTLFEYQD